MDKQHENVEYTRLSSEDLPNAQVWPLFWGGLLARFCIRCDRNASEVLPTAQGVIRSILENRDRLESMDPAWTKVLPSEFVNRSSPHPSTEEIERLALLSVDDRIKEQRKNQWSIPMVVNSFDDDLGLRGWRWNFATIRSESEIELYVEVKDTVFTWRGLTWVFLGSGAKVVALDEVGVVAR